MIAFGCAIGEAEPYLRYAKPGVERAKEADSQILAYAAVNTIVRSYNLLLDSAAGLEDLEALVLVHPYTEIAEGRFCEQVREALSDPEVAVVGAAGAQGVRTIAWWEGEVSCSDRFLYAYHDHGGGTLKGIPWTVNHPAPAEVDAVDGFLLVLSPWAVANLRFDEELMLSHGYDVDFCLQAKTAGKRVRTANFGVVERRSLELILDLDVWTEAHVNFARRWEGRIPGQAAGEDIRARARRAEAVQESTRSQAYFNRLVHEARLEPLEKELRELSSTGSWRITEPLRRLSERRRQHAAGRQPEQRYEHTWR